MLLRNKFYSRSSYSQAEVSRLGVSVSPSKTSEILREDARRMEKLKSS